MRRGPSPFPRVSAVHPATAATLAPPWERLAPLLPVPGFVQVRTAEASSSPHAFSVCLYREPSFEQRFPGRDFAQRYLQPRGEIVEFLRRHGARLIVWCDEAMLETVLAMGYGDVFLVTDPPAHPWAQHLWRYWSCHLALDPAIKALHFRGLDNLLNEDFAMLDRFVASGCDVLRASYRRGARSRYTPVRGSCSLARHGITSLAHHMRMERPSPLSLVWPEPFHIDEAFLASWWRSALPWLDVMSYVDRVQHPRFWRECHATIEHGRKLIIEGLKRDDGPLWRKAF